MIVMISDYKTEMFSLIFLSGNMVVTQARAQKNKFRSYPAMEGYLIYRH